MKNCEEGEIMMSEETILADEVASRLPGGKVLIMSAGQTMPQLQTWVSDFTHPAVAHVRDIAAARLASQPETERWLGQRG